ncbi:biotin transporter BioY [Streptococcus agalactiae]|uniref:biotin transporter BioY n=1 Tax=Streptococcus agalactiae TaxID=1311 RepID=UPI003C760081
MNTRTTTYIALMIALLIVLGFIPGIPLGFIPVPIVLQNLGVMLAGALLGSRKGFLSVAIFLILVAIGAPFLPGGRSGLVTLFGPTAGYLLAYPFAAFFIGLGLEKLKTTELWVQFFVIWIFGVLLIDICGSIVLSIQTSLPLAQSLFSNLVFIPGDTLKASICLIIYRKFSSRLTHLCN